MSSSVPNKFYPFARDDLGKAEDNKIKHDTYEAIRQADFNPVEISHEYDFHAERNRNRRLTKIVNARDTLWAEVPRETIGRVAAEKVAHDAVELDNLKVEMEAEMRRKNELHEGQELRMNEVRKEYWRRRAQKAREHRTSADSELFGELSREEEDWIAKGYPRYLTSEEIAAVEAEKDAHDSAKIGRQGTEQQKSKLPKTSTLHSNLFISKDRTAPAAPEDSGHGRPPLEIKNVMNKFGEERNGDDQHDQMDTEVSDTPRLERKDSAMSFSVSNPNHALYGVGRRRRGRG